jgi:hypothetical protein
MKKIFQNFLRAILSLTFKRSKEYKLNQRWTDMDYILKFTDFNSEFLKENKHVIEIEHQVGRFLNMQKIIQELDGHDYNIKGDIVEFGTWQGLGLIYFARLLGSNPNKRRLIGIDSFEGLPHDSTIWKKGDFANTELNFVASNFFRYVPKSFDSDFFFLIKGWFSDLNVKKQLHNQVKEISLVHFDADLYTSTKEALILIEPYLKYRIDPIYFLFDDWGCHQNEVPDAFYEWLEDLKSRQKVTIIKLSTTKLTRYYKLVFK